MSILGLIFNLKQKVHNRFQLKKVKKTGQSNVFGKINIIYPRNLTIGSGCSINHGAYINAFCPITLGNDVTISAGAKIIATGIDYLSWAEGEKRHINDGSIVISDHVWIGSGAQILAGVHITGNYVVVAAGAVVTHDITDSKCIIAGCPAKVIKHF